MQNWYLLCCAFSFLCYFQGFPQANIEAKCKEICVHLLAAPTLLSCTLFRARKTGTRPHQLTGLNGTQNLNASTKLWLDGGRYNKSNSYILFWEQHVLIISFLLHLSSEKNRLKTFPDVVFCSFHCYSAFRLLRSRCVRHSVGTYIFALLLRQYFCVGVQLLFVFNDFQWFVGWLRCSR